MYRWNLQYEIYFFTEISYLFSIHIIFSFYRHYSPPSFIPPPYTKLV